MRHDAGSSAAIRIFRFALRMLPPWIRDGWGDEMSEAFADALRTREGGWARIRFTARSVADVVWNGVRERRRGEPLPGEGARRPNGRGTMGGDWSMDLKVALRGLRRSPGFAFGAVAILALGIGANTALFSALRGALLTPPPFPDPDRIVLLDLTDSSTVRPERSGSIPWSYPKYRVLAEAEGLALTARGAYAARNLTLTGLGDATVLPVEIATPGYFDVLGTRPVLGRAFGPDDDGEGAELVVLLSHPEWVDRFGASPDVVGRTLTLNGQGVVVVGVLPEGFDGLSGNARLWVTPHAAGRLIRSFLVTGAQAHWLQAVGRLTPEASLDVLRDRMRAVGEAAEAVAPDSDPTVVRSGSARGLMDVRVGERARRSLVVLSAAAALLLLVACANLGGLLSARASARRREVAVRAALGAGRWRVARGILVESLVLALLAGAASAGVAWGASAWLGTAWPGGSLSEAWNVDVVGLGAAVPDGGALIFAAGVSVAVGLLLGGIPALAAIRTGPGGALGREGAGRRPTSVRLGSGLVAAEVAVALVLLVGAGLLVRSLQALHGVDRGYEAGALLSFNVRAPTGSARADDPAAFHEEIEARLAALPGVEAVGMGCVAPVSGHCMITGVRQAGDRVPAEADRQSIGVHWVSDGWFGVLGVPVLRGRGFDSRDQSGSAPVVVLSERAAVELFPDGDALGQRIALGVDLTPSDTDATAEVVGIVGDVLYDRPENGVMPEAYLSHRQDESPGTFVVRARGEPLALMPDVRRIVRDLEPDAPLVAVRTLADIEAAAVSGTRTLSVLLLVFAGLSVLLACTGVWAAVAFSVARRTREFGVRLALGARPGQVVGGVVRTGVASALAGLGVGLVAAWYAVRVLDTLLFEVRAADPWAFGGGAALLLSVAFAAAWVPARRVTRVDPVASLKAE